MMHIKLLNYDILSFVLMYFSMIYCFFPFMLIWEVKLWYNYDRFIIVQILGYGKYSCWNISTRIHGNQKIGNKTKKKTRKLHTPKFIKLVAII
jgi:hypothetical protein